jgi:hypothetical protein
MAPSRAICRSGPPTPGGGGRRVPGSPGLEGERGRTDSRALGTGDRRGGWDSLGLGKLREPLGSSMLPRASLYSRQHAGQRHSTTISPALALLRLSRHPNCALMSV